MDPQLDLQPLADPTQKRFKQHEAKGVLVKLGNTNTSGTRVGGGKPSSRISPTKRRSRKARLKLLPSLIKQIDCDETNDQQLGGSYGGFGVAEGSPMWRREWKAAGVIVRSEHDALFRGRGCERRVWMRRLERGCGGREDIAFVLRRVVGDEDDRRCAAGSAAIVMRCQS